MSFFQNLKWFVEGIHEANKELVSGVKEVGKEFRTDMKDVVKKHNPTMGKAVEGVDRVAQTIGNVIKAAPKPHTTVPDMRDIFKDMKELRNESDLELADHLSVIGGVRIPGYSHHALYLGDNQVIHYQHGEVRVDSVEDFRRGGELRVIDSVCTYSKEFIISRAYSRIGEKNYNLIFNNCEHFVNWCRSGSNTTDSI
ncbi:lecithin retinol acyltransferase family protein [Peribacillus asahii]|uniref:lecithin retinol acyltransferase family protein n=1 Tax=Peribacillus asahii TaxID=228899 RepID=UPI0037FA3812